MNIPYIRAPHTEGAARPGFPSQAPNAALLIDFDNVTMGMRSDLSKELKNLLATDVIRGKVTVQRAYADWRRYPQYIVPLSEASVDLIFAPAYGSSKKNATDIRMAIDGMELVFTRPEIGTYILLTGDSDFSSLVLKLKEYGKYVIGVGIQESSSDILVQNCDEYYSYTSLSGLRKAGSGETVSAQDPWALVQRAVDQMTKRRDVMRSDRLKQVMLDLDASFDEKAIGFSKFSRFLTEAAQKGLLELKKLENGQYEVSAGRNAAGSGASAPPAPSHGRDGSRRDRDRDRSGRREPREARPERIQEASPSEPSEHDRTGTDEVPASSTERAPSEPASADREPGTSAAPGGAAPSGVSTELREAVDLLVRAIRDLAENEGDAVRDSDVKRRMLALEASFDESRIGFAKFSHFLKKADEEGVIDLTRDDNGVYEVRIREGVKALSSTPAPAETSPTSGASSSTPAAPAASPDSTSGPDLEDDRRLRPRLSARRRGGKDEPPPLLEGQAVVAPSAREEQEETTSVEVAPAASSSPGAGKPEDGSDDRKGDGRRRGRRKEPAKKAAEAAEPAEPAGKASGRKASPGRDAAKREQGRKEGGKKESARKETSRSTPTLPSGPAADLPQLGLPADVESIAAYLTNSYRGIGKKTAETLLERHGARIFAVMETDPDAIRALLPAARAETLLEQWIDDVARRRAEIHGPAGRKPAEVAPVRRRSPGGGRRRGGGRSSR